MIKIQKLNSDLTQLMKQAWEIREKNFSPLIEFDIPQDTMTVSLTGSYCSLDCAHCGGYYLKEMNTIDEARKKLSLDHHTSWLVSGGCDQFGAVQFNEGMEFIKEARQRSKKINMHVGLIAQEQIAKIVSLVDCVSFDFVVDDETIKEVYGLKRTASDYIETYKSLRAAVKVVPHICIGLKGGEIQGEYEALKVLKELGLDELVFIIFIPTPGTRYADRTPLALEKVVEVLAKARIEFPDIPIHLGCMRPTGKLRAEIDYYGVQCGVNKIVNPTRYGIKKAEDLGLDIKYGRECCVL